MKLDGAKFMFVASFASLTQDEARARVKSFGGKVVREPSIDLGFLVVGFPINGPRARDVRLAVEKLVARGSRARIIDEGSFLAITGGYSAAYADKPRGKHLDRPRFRELPPVATFDENGKPTRRMRERRKQR